MITETKGAGLFFHVYGRAFEVCAVADNDKEANEHMGANPGASVIHCHNGLVIMADKSDEGRKL